MSLFAALDIFLMLFLTDMMSWRLLYILTSIIPLPYLYYVPTSFLPPLFYVTTVLRLGVLLSCRYQPLLHYPRLQKPPHSCIRQVREILSDSHEQVALCAD